jgi:hypothetical protein
MSGLGAEILEEERVHRALEADVKLGDLALRQGDDRHAREPQAFEGTGDVLLIAADPVQSLGHDHVELARQSVAEQRLDARAKDHRRTRDRRV